MAQPLEIRTKHQHIILCWAALRLNLHCLSGRKGGISRSGAIAELGVGILDTIRDMKLQAEQWMIVNNR
jgi:hypothetical protein